MDNDHSPAYAFIEYRQSLYYSNDLCNFSYDITFLQEVGHQFRKLTDQQQLILVAAAACQNKPWLKGEAWEWWLARLNMKRRDYQRELGKAIQRLDRLLERAGLI